MNVIVVDASVAAKWFLPAKGETLTDEALHLLRRYVSGEVRFVVPDLNGQTNSTNYFPG